jgi:pfkB family carbohydrate kinase
LAAFFGNNDDLVTIMSLILANTDLEGIIVTCAEQGAMALDNKGKLQSVSPVLPIETVDTVGAGDAFSAVILLGLGLGWELGILNGPTLLPAPSSLALLFTRPSRRRGVIFDSRYCLWGVAKTKAQKLGIKFKDRCKTKAHI